MNKTKTVTKASAPETRTVPAERPTAIKINQPYVEQGSKPRIISEAEFLQGLVLAYGLPYIVASVNHASKLADALRGLRAVAKLSLDQSTTSEGLINCQALAQANAALAAWEEAQS